jgi:hypothetical protein
MELLIFCIQVSLACLAIHVAICHQGMILNFLYEPAKLLTEEWLSKPLFDCMMCMASFWTLVFWLFYNKPFTFDFVFSVLVVSGLNKLICAFLERSTDYGC